MQCKVQCDYDRIAENRRVSIRLLASVTAEVIKNHIRRPLNLSVALDRSGSMSGAKLNNVKAATRLLTKQLLPTDVFSLTVFDDSVDCVIPAMPVGKARMIIGKTINNIDAGGSTNLSGAYAQGATQAIRFRSNDMLSRIVLLTDGLANIGETRPEMFARQAEEYLAHGISTTTIGVGADYHEEMLGQIAKYGSGGTYFLNKPEEAHAVFTEELGLLLNTSIRNLEVSFDPMLPGLTFQQLNNYREPAPGRFWVGDAYGGQEKGIVLELSIPRQQISRQLTLGNLIFRGQQMTDIGPKEFFSELPVTISVISEIDFLLVRPDRHVSLQAAYLTVARAKQSAIELADKRQFNEAAAILERCVRVLTELDLRDHTLDEYLSDLAEQAQALREQKEYFYDRMTRKRLYTEGEVLATSAQSSYGAMRLRQGKLGKKPGWRP